MGREMIFVGHCVMNFRNLFLHYVHDSIPKLVHFNQFKAHVLTVQRYSKMQTIIFRQHNIIKQFYYRQTHRLNTQLLVFEYQNNSITLAINSAVYDKLIRYLRKTNINPNLWNDFIFVIIYRYSLLDGQNQQLAISIPFKKKLFEQFGINTELFGSGINRFFDHYCSLFYDIEKHFGSFGNFFDVKPVSGYYMCNPPYDDSIMASMSKHLVKCLDRASKNKLELLFIITIPIWDYETLQRIKEKCQIKKIIDYGSYDAYTILVNSPYLYKVYEFCSTDFPYYNFSQQRYIYAANTYIIIVKTLAAEKISIDKYFEWITSKTNPYMALTTMNTAKRTNRLKTNRVKR